MSERLCDALKRMPGVLRGIDLRSAIIYVDKEWRNVITIIRFSHLEPKAMEKQIYDALEARWPKVNTERLKIICKALPLSHWDMLVSSFKEGVHRLEDINIVVSKQNLDELSGDIGTGSSYLAEPEWKILEFRTSKSGYNWETVNSEAKGLGFPDLYATINAWLDSRFGRSESFTMGKECMIISIPIYAKIIDHDFYNGKAKVDVKFHEGLDNLLLSVATYGGGDYGYQRKAIEELHHIPISPDKSKNLDEGFKLFSYEVELASIRSSDYLEVKLIHTKPSGLELDRIGGLISSYLASKEPAKNPMLWAFDRFCNIEELRSQLSDPYSARPEGKMGPEKIFERAVSWLLSLCGLSVIRLDEYEKLKTKDRKVQINSVDLLAFDKNSSAVALVACTIGSPKMDEDIPRIKQVKAMLEKELYAGQNIRIIPIIFSAYKDLPTVRESAEKHGVVIIDSLTAEKILNLIRDAKTENALHELAL